MLSFPRWKVLLILFACLLGAYFAAPNFVSNDNKVAKYLPTNRVHLGLDLQGGSHLLLDIDFQTYFKENIQFLVGGLRKELRAKSIFYKDLNSQHNKITFSLKDAAQADLVKKIISDYSADLKFLITENKVEIYYSDESLANTKRKIIDQSIEIVRRRVDETGTKEPIIQRQGESYILLQVPGVEDPDQLRRLLGKTAKLSFKMLNVSHYESNLVPLGSELLKDEQGREYLVYKETLLSGDSLVDARATLNDKSQPVVFFQFNDYGAKVFGDLTRENVGKPLAITLDDKILCAPMINEPILGGSGTISGSYTVQTANDLALLLRAGALPAKLDIIEERTVGPSLGIDSIEAGKLASVVGIVIVMVFIFWTYGVLGLFANVALIFNMIFLLAILSLLQATLTMPGIAGVVLTIGMSVDANVLIFERIREEQRKKNSLLNSVQRGFSQAFLTIFDSNLTTIIAALILYEFGTGAVKGFAVTLGIGVAASMFSAITLTKMMIYFWIRWRKPSSLNL